MSMGSVTINIVVVVLMKIETISNQIRRSTKNGLDLDMRGLLNLGQLNSASFHQHCLICNEKYNFIKKISYLVQKNPWKFSRYFHNFLINISKMDSIWTWEAFPIWGNWVWLAFTSIVWSEIRIIFS